MKLNNLTPAEGSRGKEKRVGRGEGSGHGGQSCRGMNGAKARSGYSKKIGFEGGQMPIQRRLPKFGFTNPNRVSYKGVNVEVLDALAKANKLKKIDVEVLREAGYVSKNELVKILGNGDIKAKIEVVADAFSASAIQKIEAAGGKAIKAE